MKGEPFIVHPSAAVNCTNARIGGHTRSSDSVIPFIVPVNGPLVHFFPNAVPRNRDGTRCGWRTPSEEEESPGRV